MTDIVEPEGVRPRKTQAPNIKHPNGAGEQDSDAKVLKIARKGLQTPPKQVSDAKLLELAKEANQPAGNILGGGPSPGPDPYDLAAVRTPRSNRGASHAAQ